MSRLMVPAAAVAAAAAIVTAGCASAGASGPGSLDGAAAIVPSNTVAFVAASTDLGSSQWHGVGKQFLTQFKSLAPALGDELDVAVLPGKQIVGLTQPQDGAKLAALAKKHERADARDRRLDRGRKDVSRAGHGREREVASLGQRRLRGGDEPAAERRARARVRERAGSPSSCSRRSPARRGDDRGAERRALPLQGDGSEQSAVQRRARPSSAGPRPRVTSTSDGLKVEAFAQYRRAHGVRRRLATSCIRRRRTPLRSSTRFRRARSRSST